jgi:hypothetical protein
MCEKRLRNSIRGPGPEWAGRAIEKVIYLRVFLEADIFYSWFEQQSWRRYKSSRKHLIYRNGSLHYRKFCTK